MSNWGLTFLLLLSEGQGVVCGGGGVGGTGDSYYMILLYVLFTQLFLHVYYTGILYSIVVHALFNNVTITTRVESPLIPRYSVIVAITKNSIVIIINALKL